MVRLFLVLSLFCLSGIPFGCQSSTTSKTASRSAAPTRMVLPENQYSAIAEREIVRRKERIAAADQVALRAAQKNAVGDTEGAIADFQQALSTLPATR